MMRGELAIEDDIVNKFSLHLFNIVTALPMCMRLRVCHPSKKASLRLSNATGLSWSLSSRLWMTAVDRRSHEHSDHAAGAST